ncbi:proton channel OtopLc isoform X3 [Dermacentor silvarum]|uniref:proton channel OtopLc isoform X3 n=1 Tax=Dermacentor silvarum TaxID=543639 RepID=UPI00189720EE|nr:proton channel OtopLc isoform X3 [Dermacentor silvarum]XP_049521232.1 proton channel OtopLc isoform X3 [Dermacentor silvarum]
MLVTSPDKPGRLAGLSALLVRRLSRCLPTSGRLPCDRCGNDGSLNSGPGCDYCRPRKKVQFIVGNWDGLDRSSPTPPPESPDGTSACPETSPLMEASGPKPVTIQRSASFNFPSTSQRNSANAAAGGAEVCPPPPGKSSDDSGLGTGNSPRGKKPALTIDIQRIPPSRASSYGGSLCSLPTSSNGKMYSARRTHGDLDSLVIMLSALYAKLLVIMGICFPLAEVISKKIPVSFYEGFYLYLYFGSIAFLLYVYVFLLRHDKVNSKLDHLTDSFGDKLRRLLGMRSSRGTNMEIPPTPKKRVHDATTHAGSFYLRLGAVAFGTGSMIYSGLEFGQFFEMESDSKCYNILFSLTPATRMAFTFFQLYFIFINSRVAINKFTTFARFGLMHMISANICVWLHVLIQETKHQLLDFIQRNETNLLAMAINPIPNIASEEEEEHLNPVHYETHSKDHHRIERSAGEHGLHHDTHNCRRANIMGELVQNASPFLFPCTIEYSLISAGILYIMWKNVGSTQPVPNTPDSSIHVHTPRQRHYYQVDCAKANKGLFTGILVLVLSIISLILFFVLINKPQYRNLAVMEAHIAELAVYFLASLATTTALFQVRELRYNRLRNTDLDSILLIVAQSGLYLYTMFSIIGSHFTLDQNTMLALLTALACLIQGSLQTIFILDASRRYVSSSDQANRKPGREMVTFLIVCNFSMWAINTLETRRADSNPVQMTFYGFWAWTIITHVTAPLTIFFRFHSTVCLCDIWKRAYKVKSDYL